MNWYLCLLHRRTTVQETPHSGVAASGVYWMHTFVKLVKSNKRRLTVGIVASGGWMWKAGGGEVLRGRMGRLAESRQIFIEQLGKFWCICY